MGANTVLYEFHETVITGPAGGPNSKPMCHPYILTSRRGDHPVSSKGYAGRLRKGSKTLGHAEWHRSWKRQTVSRSHGLVDGWWMRRRNPKKVAWDIVVPLIKRIVVVDNLVNAFLLARRPECYVRVHHNQCDMPWLTCELSNRVWTSSIGSTFGSSITWGILFIKSRFFPSIIAIFGGKLSWVPFLWVLGTCWAEKKV